MKVNSRIELEFAGINLPIGKDAEGRDVVPLKPISDVFGLKWSDQHSKLMPKTGTCVPANRDAGTYLGRLLGVCTPQKPPQIGTG